MRKGKRLVAALVCAALLVLPALAAEGEAQQKFPAVNTYADGQFADVKEGTGSPTR